MDKDTFYWYWLNGIKGVGPVIMNRLLSVSGGSAEAVYRTEPEGFIGLDGVTDEIISNIKESKQDGSIYENLLLYEEKGFHFVTRNDPQFPKNLKNIPDPPVGLFMRGNLIEHQPPIVAMVGSRGCTVYGREVAYNIARKLSEIGVIIVSGMAAGIDSASHRGCITGGMPTFAVLACGVDTCYPAANIDLFENILRYNGTIISEYEPGTAPIKGRFPMRNRLISGMADALIIVEARAGSGSLLTAEYALEQNKDIFCVPGRITDPLSSGTNNLIKNGANMLTCVEDILIKSGIRARLDETKEESYGNSWEIKKRHVDPLNKNERTIYSAFSKNWMSLDQIVKASGLPVSTVQVCLIQMELKGAITLEAQGLYSRNALDES